MHKPGAQRDLSSSKARIRVSYACNTCRAKRIKCDGTTPKCHTCIVGGRTCQYSRSKRNTRTSSEFQSLSSPRDPSVHSGLPSRSLENATPGETESQSTLSLLDSLTRSQKERLFHAYFTCIHPLWPLLYKPLYNSTTLGDLSDGMPISLVYAIFAIATCVQPDQLGHTDRVTDGLEFSTSRMAKAETASLYLHAAILELQQDGRIGDEIGLFVAMKPTTANCQVLTVLALQQHGVAEFGRAGLLCTIPAAMAVELRLHRNIWNESPVEAEIASRLWWNIYVLDKMLASETGRPVLLRSEESDAPYPSLCESDEFELFNLGQNNLTKHHSIPSAKLHTVSAFITTIELTKIEERIMREIYSMSAQDLLRKNKVLGDELRVTLTLEIEAWHEKIEASHLKLVPHRNPGAPPAVVTNYIIMHSLIILLHRPFIAHWEQEKLSSGYAPFPTSDPADMCLQAAKSICQLLGDHCDYVPLLPADLIFIVFTVAGVVLRECQKPTQKKTEMPLLYRHVRQCTQWLQIFGKNWKNADARHGLLNEKFALTNTIPSLDATEPRSGPFSRSEQLGNTAGWEPAAVPSFDESSFANFLSEVEEWGLLQDPEVTFV